MSDEWPKTPFKHLLPERAYVVMRSFADFDGGQHSEGERWTFIGYSFLPYDDGLSLFAIIGGERRHIRMQWREEEQGPIIDRLEDFLHAVK